MANYTLNYTGEKVDELLNKIDTAFGETTVTKEAITWDGNTDGLYSVMGMFHHVSGAVPTLEDLQNGGTFTMFTPDGEANGEFTAENVMDAETVGMGTNLVMVQTDMGGILIATEDGAIIIEGGTSITFDKAGIYFGGDGSTYTSSFTINDYTFTETEIKTINSKYLPNDSGGANVFIVNAEGSVQNGSFAIDKTLAEILQAYEKGCICFMKLNNRLIPLTEAASYASLGYPGVGEVTFEGVDVNFTTNQMLAEAYVLNNVDTSGATTQVRHSHKAVKFELNDYWTQDL